MSDNSTPTDLRALLGGGITVYFGEDEITLPNKSIRAANVWREKFRGKMPLLHNMWVKQSTPPPSTAGLSPEAKADVLSAYRQDAENSGNEAANFMMLGDFLEQAAELIHDWDPKYSPEWLLDNATPGQIIYAFQQIWSLINPFGSRYGQFTKRILGLEMDTISA